MLKLKHLLLLILLPMLVACANNDWRTANRASAGLAPDPHVTPEPVIQVYAADAWGWRGIFAVHTWIAVKPRNADQYTV